ncbi:NAD(P)H-hydrate epimerase [Microbacterium sp. M3]|uniref:NAD(P)H-hydrate epimerase n=2 Tax=Microbacterium arthrosphaerae TaxID=792652 RepID=A0ABU4GYV7_9MICO|nr:MULTISPECIES: NAD(P)H-hydrate epimerase [Microbacterium]MDW4572244.1 NAD(P)H-hydrate epimerase [Microbacterium arthrosphaerae]MDW7606099.1 NAD(P)H-hydrate epimerase [Microbacterium sp. M3]
MSERVPAYTAAQVRAAERPLLDAGVPLMQRAAAALAEVVRDELARIEPTAVTPPHRTLEPVVRQSPDAPLPRVLVLAGSGDNGGDALYAAARLAADADADVDALLVADRFHQDALTSAIGAGVRRIDLAEAGDVGVHYALVLDGILGIGASADPALRGSAREAVTDLLSRARAEGRMPRIVAVDIPSGLHPDTGEADDAVLPASVTVTFGAVKAGLTSGRGPELAGDLVLVDLGLGEGLATSEPAGEASVTRIVEAREP